jgi:hypothetical protein
MIESVIFAAALAAFPQWSKPRAVTTNPHEHFLASYFAIAALAPSPRLWLCRERSGRTRRCYVA